MFWKKSKIILYDENFNKVDENIDDYFFYDNNVITYKEEGLSVYKSKNKILQYLDYKGKLFAFSDNYIVLKIDNKINLLSYDNLINNKNDLIDTGIKIEKDESYSLVREEKEKNEIILDIDVENKTLKEKKKLCELKQPYEYSEPISNKTKVDINYKYNLKTKSLEKEIICSN